MPDYRSNPKLKFLGRFMDKYFIILDESTHLEPKHIYDAYEALEDVETATYYGRNLVKKGELFLNGADNSGERKMGKEHKSRYVNTAVPVTEAASAVLNNLKGVVKEYEEALTKLGLPKEELLAFANIKE